MEGRESDQEAWASRKALTSLAKSSERQAVATEKLLELATREAEGMMEPGPSVCPGCQKHNPIVTHLGDTGTDGPLDQFVLVGETHCCNTVIFAVPIAFVTTTHQEAALELVNEKGGSNGRNSENP